MTKQEAKLILDQYRDGKLFLPRKIRQALSVSEDLRSPHPNGIVKRMERPHLVSRTAVGE